MTRNNSSLAAQLEAAYEKAEDKLANLQRKEFDPTALEKVAIRYSYEAAQHVTRTIANKVRDFPDDSLDKLAGRVVLRRMFQAWKRFTRSAQGSESVFQNSFAQLLKDLAEPIADEALVRQMPGSNALSFEASEKFTEILEFHQKRVSEAL